MPRGINPRLKALCGLGLISAICLVDAPAHAQLCPPASGGQGGLVMPVERAGAPLPRLTPDSTVGAVLTHPAFAGYGRLLFPWDNRNLDETLKLGQAASLMPYHSHVEAQTVVSGLNRMVADAEAGRAVYFDVYPEAAKRAQPALGNTALFFFRGRKDAPFALIAPGGGFSYVGSLHEGFPYAEAISKQGYNAFVLRYRTGSGGGVATEDMAAALSTIMRNADCLGVSRMGYSLWGSSAGARMAAAIGSHGAQRFGGDAIPVPAAVIMAYTGHSDHARTEPPTFVVVGAQDGIAPPQAMERRISALRGLGTRVEYRKIPGLGHGFGTGDGTAAEGWIEEAIRFWKTTLPESQKSR
jgi:acetyl esterase/lipase